MLLFWLAMNFGAIVEEPAAPPREDRIVCRQLNETNTRLGRRRICLRQSQWDSNQDIAAGSMSRAQDKQDVVRYGTGGRSTCPTC